MRTKTFTTVRRPEPAMEGLWPLYRHKSAAERPIQLPGISVITAEWRARQSVPAAVFVYGNCIRYSSFVKHSELGQIDCAETTNYRRAGSVSVR
jgi:hypothetical protein